MDRSPIVNHNNNHDKHIIDLFIMPGTNRIRLRLYNIYKTDKYSNIKHYIETRYSDSESINETIFRILYNMELRPVCEVCGKLVNYIGKPNTKGLFAKYCCSSCRAKATYSYRDNNTDKAKQTKKNRYGDAGYNNKEQIAKTKKDRYNNAGYNNKEQIAETKLERYNDATYNNIEKIAQTNLNKYGDVHYVNPNKAKETKLERYGSETYNNRDKAEITNNERYGYNTPLKNKQIQEVIKQTFLDLYGVDNPAKCDVIKEKAKQTNIKRYGYEYAAQAKQVREKNKMSQQSLLTKLKKYNTRKKNNTFNASLTETESYKLLIEKYPNTKKQFRSALYPFNCDFYIPELDLYIECNYHWTHGGHSYNKLKDAKILLEWEKKSQTSNFYKNAIETWTIRDVKKLETAKKNKLNYKIFYTIDELKEWIVLL